MLRFQVKVKSITGYRWKIYSKLGLNLHLNRRLCFVSFNKMGMLTNSQL